MAHDQHGHGSDSESNKLHHSHILPTNLILKVGAALMVGTVLTVAVAHIDLGAWNFPIAMLVATIKGALVAMIFMNLKYDSRENAVIFCTSFVFLAIFIVLVGTDLFFRGDIYYKMGSMPSGIQAKSKLKNPWIPTPEMVANGKTLFAQNGCVTCHGEQGHGDGIGGAALNPKPRNFTQNEGWKNGRRTAMVFKTLKEGIPGSGMASYASLSIDDRWQLAAYVLSLGPTPAVASNAEDFKKIGLDPSKPNGGLGGDEAKPSIPVEVAMERMEAAPLQMVQFHALPAAPYSVSGQLYLSRCASCHGSAGEGGIHVKRMGASEAWAQTTPLNAKSMALMGQHSFEKLVVNGLQGDLMPGNADLSALEIRELFSYLKH